MKRNFPKIFILTGLNIEKPMFLKYTCNHNMIADFYLRTKKAVTDFNSPVYLKEKLDLFAKVIMITEICVIFLHFDV